MPGRTPAGAAATATGPNTKRSAAYDQVVAAPQPMFRQLGMEGKITIIVITMHQIMAGLKTAAIQYNLPWPLLKGVYDLVIKT
jgi:hypothetical protein